MANPFDNENGFIPHLPGMPEAINADSFDEDVLLSDVPVLVEFWTARCAPCRRLAPELQAVAETFRGRLRVFTIDVDQELPAATRFAVHSVPAILLFVRGAEVNRFYGITDRDTLTQAVAECLNAKE
ncbi:MAG: thiol reductase thioredoxin [Armatimonadetes bacterium]|nr:thiol reductase thioredoxin [Armatimonadota bacterium]